MHQEMRQEHVATTTRRGVSRVCRWSAADRGTRHRTLCGVAGAGDQRRGEAIAGRPAQVAHANLTGVTVNIGDQLDVLQSLLTASAKRRNCPTG